MQRPGWRGPGRPLSYALTGSADAGCRDDRDRGQVEMSSSRWDPWGDIISLREAMNNLLEESFVRPRSGGGAAPGSLGLAVDLLETPSAFILTASVPGVKPSDVSITVLGDTLTIAGHRAEPRDDHS